MAEWTARKPTRQKACNGKLYGDERIGEVALRPLSDQPLGLRLRERQAILVHGFYLSKTEARTQLPLTPLSLGELSEAFAPELRYEFQRAHRLATLAPKPLELNDARGGLNSDPIIKPQELKRVRNSQLLPNALSARMISPGNLPLVARSIISRASSGLVLKVTSSGIRARDPQPIL